MRTVVEPGPAVQSSAGRSRHSPRQPCHRSAPLLSTRDLLWRDVALNLKPLKEGVDPVIVVHHGHRLDDGPVEDAHTLQDCRVGVDAVVAPVYGGHRQCDELFLTRGELSARTQDFDLLPLSLQELWVHRHGLIGIRHERHTIGFLDLVVDLQHTTSRFLLSDQLHRWHCVSSLYALSSPMGPAREDSVPPEMVRTVLLSS